MTEFESHHPFHRDEDRRQIPKSSSSNSSTSGRLVDWSYERFFNQTVDKMDDRSKNITLLSTELRKCIPNPSDISYKRSMDEKQNGLFLDDYKRLLKSDVRPSDSSYSRKVSWDASISAETSSLIGHSSKSHQVGHVKQECHPMYLASKYYNVPPISTEKIITDNHRKNSYPLCSDKRKTVEYRTGITQLAETAQMNGTIHDSHSNSSPFYKAVDQMVNNLHFRDLSPSLSRKSSHLQSNGSEGLNNLLTTSGDKHPAFSKEHFRTKYPTHGENLSYLSPILNHVPHNNPKDTFLAAISQKTVASEESTSRPNSSFRAEEENSNDDKSLAVSFSNTTTNSADTVTPTPEKSRYPYSIDMKEGMFKTVKTGPEHETLKIHIIENYGSGDLKNGGFSWGWSIEQRSSAQPSPKTSSVPREKNYTRADKDIHKSKRRLEYEKASSSPSHKKSKGSSSEVQDITRCREKSSKEIKSKSNHIPSKHSSPHIKRSYMHEEKPTTKSSKSSLVSPTVTNKSLSAVKTLNFDRQCELAVSPLEKRKSPIYVPLSEMVVHPPKTDCLGKSNNVIDDSTMGFISSKKERSAVYSGRKSALEIQSLKAMCFEAVKKNLLSLKIGENVPSELLMPALKLCSPSKLLKIEEHNRHIVSRTDCLWRKFCESEFRDQKRLNGEAWKDVYWRARNLREKKLKNLAASISNGMAKAHPERQAKWVGIGTNNPEKRQRKVTKVEEVHKTEKIPSPKPEANGKGSGSSSSHKEPPAKKRSGSESSSSDSPHSAYKPASQSKSQVPKAAKKTLAPLMSKTKKMLNLVNRRR